jgi:hypothetical protein
MCAAVWEHASPTISKGINLEVKERCTLFQTSDLLPSLCLSFSLSLSLKPFVFFYTIHTDIRLHPLASPLHSPTLCCISNCNPALLPPRFPRIEHLSPATLEALSSLAVKEPEQVQRLEALLAGDVSRLLRLQPAAKRAKIEDTPQATASPATTAATAQATDLGEGHVPLLVLKDAVRALRMLRVS